MKEIAAPVEEDIEGEALKTEMGQPDLAIVEVPEPTGPTRKKNGDLKIIIDVDNDI